MANQSQKGCFKDHGYSAVHHGCLAGYPAFTASTAIWIWMHLLMHKTLDQVNTTSAFSNFRFEKSIVCWDEDMLFKMIYFRPMDVWCEKPSLTYRRWLESNKMFILVKGFSVALTVILVWLISPTFGVFLRSWFWISFRRPVWPWLGRRLPED